MIDFIIEHPSLLPVVIGLVADIVLTILVLIFRKKSTTKDFIINIIDSVLPGYINLAEESASDGDSKLCMVIELVIKRIHRYIKKDDLSFYRSLIIEKTEAILSCPQKKEKL